MISKKKSQNVGTRLSSKKKKKITIVMMMSNNVLKQNNCKATIENENWNNFKLPDL